MFRYLHAAVLCFVVVIFLGLTAVLSDPLSLQKKRRNEQRKVDVQFLVDRIEAYARRNHSVPPFTSKLQQLGTAHDGCQVHTPACQIETASCLDVNMVMENKNLSIPSDLSIGSYYKTGYAAYFNAATGEVIVTACGAESATTISLTRSLQKVLFISPTQHDN